MQLDTSSSSSFILLSSVHFSRSTIKGNLFSPLHPPRSGTIALAARASGVAARPWFPWGSIGFEDESKIITETSKSQADKMALFAPREAPVRSEIEDDSALLSHIQGIRDWISIPIRLEANLQRCAGQSAATATDSNYPVASPLLPSELPPSQLRSGIKVILCLSLVIDNISAKISRGLPDLFTRSHRDLESYRPCWHELLKAASYAQSDFKNLDLI